MLRSLFSGISGLRVNQTMLDVTGNNIANANTVGFKASDTIFSDTLSQMLTAASAPSANNARGGTNPIQIGLGTQLAAVNTDFTQGADETTGVSTDMMINGDGFFVVSDGQSDYLTRAGAFTFDDQGNLVDTDGKYVQGYPVSGYDATGKPEYQGSATPNSPSGTATMGNLNLNTLAAPLTAAHGALSTYQIGSDGTLTGTFADGSQFALGQIAIGNVQNPDGLDKAGDTEFLQSANSGQIQYAAAGSTTGVGQNGTITTGALEMSNVDLSAEFTNLIIAQRGFEASSKVITTSDTILSDLVNMIH